MKRRTWVASLLFVAACAPQPVPLPQATTPAAAAAIPEGRTPAERRELFQAALALYERGDARSAEPLFRRLAPVYPELADHVFRYLAKITESRGDSGAVAEWRALADRYPDSVWKGEAELAIGRARASEGDWHAAAIELAAARQDLKDPSQRAAALGLAREAERRLGDLESARALSADLRRSYPQSPEAAAAREEAWAERDRVALADAGAAREEISLLLDEGQAVRALELAQAAERRFRSDAEFPELLWLEAGALSKTGDHEAAEAALERLHAKYPRHRVAARALFRLGTLAWNRDDDDDALRLFGVYTREYPRAPQAAESIYAIGRIHQEARRYSLAVREFGRLTKLFPRNPLAAEAGFRVGWCEYRAGNRARAAEVFEDLGERGSGDRAAALYWRARASGDARDYGNLLREFPESYYASLAEERLGQPEGSALMRRLPTPDAGGGSPHGCTMSDPHLARFEELKAMGLLPLARAELGAYQERVGSRCDGFFIRAWVDVKAYRQSVGRAFRAGGCGIDSPLLRFCYPLGFWDVVEKQAAARSLDPYLVAALIRQESLFDNEARSSANALGLMQILPATGERLAAENGAAAFRTETLFDPAQNVEFGTAYLRNLLVRYGGNLPRALAAYNAGEAAVARWQRRYGNVDDDEFVESISYRETRTYVKRVIANRRIYQNLYGAPSAAPRISSGELDAG